MRAARDRDLQQIAGEFRQRRAGVNDPVALKALRGEQRRGATAGSNGGPKRPSQKRTSRKTSGRGFTGMRNAKRPRASAFTTCLDTAPRATCRKPTCCDRRRSTGNANPRERSLPSAFRRLTPHAAADASAEMPRSAAARGIGWFL